MYIKNRLLGLTALIAASVVRAAGAEREPAEYIKICDVLGSGYFYIPNTDTCLRIGGYVRYDIGLGDVRSYDSARTSDVRTGEDQGTWRNNTRFTFKTWSGQQTELGALTTYTETHVNFGNSANSHDSPQNYDFNSGLALASAWVELGGLRVGKDGSAFDTFVSYAGNVLDSMLVRSAGFDTNVAQYYFDAGNGISTVISLEQGSGSAGTIDSYIPHVVAGLKYTQGWGSITGVAAYDSNYEALAGKIRVDVAVTNQLSLFGLFGYGSNGSLNEDSNGAIANHVRGSYNIWNGQWAFWAGTTYEFDEKTSFNFQVSSDQLKNSGLAANVVYMVVPGFTVTAEVDYDHYGNFGVGPADPTTVKGTSKPNSVGGILRFQRSF
ncbi:porin [Mesorhizobium sp. M6A.T.Ce.TU.002.03.1.1]|uniref:porin n=1 Tax=Mesorhizobium sp. M6A.T.Ce.TU.002.03.1.1 TaxID=2496782 RepID=UPI000FCAA787|nr:porin [Mesorhizobium sp. M6A.T.Ce.TU.002.03.1.1]RUU45362.1 porin [Mesorhizobium sp. M6A.T.Ce.TU.002.03.1.1]